MKTRNKWFIYAIIMLMSLSYFTVGCQKKEEDSKKSSEETKSEDPPPALEELQDLSEELVQIVSKKEWSTAAEKIKSMHTKWNAFYAQGQKNGLTQDQSTAFSTDLNNLTKLIISKDLEESKKKAETEIKKAEIQLQQKTEQEGQGQQGQQEKQEGQKQGGGSGGEELTLPEEVTPDNYPDMVASSSDLAVSNAAVQLTKHIPTFLNLYKDDMSPTVLKLKYLIRDIKIESKQKNWDKVLEDLKNVKESWTLVQSKVIKEKEELGIQFNQSISELEQVASSKDETLTTIKSDITLENIKKMIELFE